ncbi:MAG TPA: TolC family protein, partial [Longimicrobiales bacterium]|nr:TolC family protein [Longimicrobiales bacterium]
RAYSPTYLSSQNDRGTASWEVREAYGAFLPAVSAQTSVAYTQAGAQRIGTLDFGSQSTDWHSSNYFVGLTWTLNGSTVFGVSNARARQRATEAGVQAAEFDLGTTVAFQYMTVLRARDGLEVARRQLDRARQNLQIVTTRVATGAVAGTDGRQAQVDLGRAEVALIQAERDLRQARLLLGERIGVSLTEEVELSSSFEVFEPGLDVDELVDLALGAHPALNAFRAQESASRARARQTSTSQYLPTVSVSTGFRGNTLEALNQDFIVGQAQGLAESRVSNCEFRNALDAGLSGGRPGYTPEDCVQYAFTEQARAAALASNDVFPFDFTKLPLSVSMTVSLPIFTGFSRARQVSEANNAAEDARHERRAEELRLRTAVLSSYDNLVSAYRLVEAESRNLTLSEEQLQLQQRRYALGAADLLLLMDAETALSSAEQGYLDAVYDFHYNLIALEASVGRTIRDR